MSALVRIQHVLHGYDRGHRLLAASVELDRAGRQLVDVLSDAAGPELRHDFDGYLTGYPLPDGRYAFACTWYAPEMPRPNCVWTHTLIVEATALAGPGTLAALCDHFRRPTGLSDLEFYRRPTPADLDDARVVTLWRGAPVWAADVLGALYTGHPAYAVGDRHAESVDFVMALSAQQWPQLRSRFSFCTAAQGQRRVGDHPFDLELLVPGRGAWGRPREARPSAPDWARLLAEDLEQPQSGLRDLVAATCGGADSAVAMCLATAWHGTGGLSREFADLLVAHAPSPRQAPGFKRAVFRPGGLLDHGRAASASTLVDLLRRPDVVRTVDPADLGLPQRVVAAWEQSPMETVRLWTQWPADERTGEGFEALTTAVLGNAGPRDLADLLRHEPELIGVVLTTKDGAEWCAAWLELPDPPFGRSVAAALKSAARWRPHVVGTLVGLLPDYPDRAARVVIGLLNLPERAVAASVVAALRAAPRSCVDTLRIRGMIGEDAVRRLLQAPLDPPELALIAELTPPRVLGVVSASELWLPVVPYAWRYTHAPVALLSLGLRHMTPFDDELLGRAYAHLWQRLRADDAQTTWNYCKLMVFPQLGSKPQRGSLTTELGRRTGWRDAEERTRIAAAAETIDPDAAQALREEWLGIL
ncbi:MAG: hypothetical protein HOV79_09570 [Hamadaea sp.]|nr:hypothetical protein [Hamadaea sp.]